MQNIDVDLAKRLIWLRIAQLLINEQYKKEGFKVPVHLALGHEAIALSVDRAMKKNDTLFLTHRNIHYNLVRQSSVKEELAEYQLDYSGLAKGHLGSMNLSNPKKGIPYASSILGNNLSVACGYALGNKIKDDTKVTFVVTGDGAMEEGSFYESLLFMRSVNLAMVLIIENNNWSLGTRIEERRSDINVKRLLKGLDIEYCSLKKNNVFNYVQRLCEIRDSVVSNRKPVVVEVNLTTLGSWTEVNEQFPDGKFINYHAGPARELDEGLIKKFPIIEKSDSDPLYILYEYFSETKLNEISVEMHNKLKQELK